MINSKGLGLAAFTFASSVVLTSYVVLAAFLVVGGGWQTIIGVTMLVTFFLTTFFAMAWAGSQ